MGIGAKILTLPRMFHDKFLPRYSDFLLHFSTTSKAHNVMYSFFSVYSAIIRNFRILNTACVIVNQKGEHGKHVNQLEFVILLKMTFSYLTVYFLLSFFG